MCNYAFKSLRRQPQRTCAAPVHVHPRHNKSAFIRVHLRSLFAGAPDINWSVPGALLEERHIGWRTPAEIRSLCELCVLCGEKINTAKYAKSAKYSQTNKQSDRDDENDRESAAGEQIKVHTLITMPHQQCEYFHTPFQEYNNELHQKLTKLHKTMPSITCIFPESMYAPLLEEHRLIAEFDLIERIVTEAKN